MIKFIDLLTVIPGDVELKVSETCHDCNVVYATEEFYNGPARGILISNTGSEEYRTSVLKGYVSRIFPNGENGMCVCISREPERKNKDNEV